MKRIIICMIFLLTSLASCEKWLDVQPSDRMTDRQLFETRDGFLKALNGVYVELNDRGIYGRFLTAEGPDRLAHLYRCAGASGYNYDFRTYAYTGQWLKPPFEHVWNKLYALIANCNMIIEQAGMSNPNLPGVWFGIVKGEALALRAFFHLDLLRLYGPVFADNPTVTCMPYTKSSDRKATPMLSAEQVLGLIIDDLKEAIALLEVDPIITDGVMNSDGIVDNNSLRYRQYRLNHYAVRALLARAYLWGGQTSDAYATASALIKEVAEANTFPWVTSAAISSATDPDRIFGPEILFATYDQSRDVSIFRTMFDVSLQESEFVTFSTPYSTSGTLYSGRIAELYPDQNDWRLRAWTENSMVTGTVRFVYQKYRQTTNPNGDVARRFRFMVPLVRISEVYLIAAECAPDLEASRGYLETIWQNRNFNNYRPVITNRADLTEAIEWESRREFLAEGQMFYYYKRNAATRIPDGNNSDASTVYLTMNPNNYVVPLPDSELQFREDNE